MLIPSLSDLSPGHSKLVAEIAMVRLFLLAENTLASIGAKVLSGADYLDGTQPDRLLGAPSMAAAVAAMKSHGRSTSKNYLSWTTSTEPGSRVPGRGS